MAIISKIINTVFVVCIWSGLYTENGKGQTKIGFIFLVTSLITTSIELGFKISGSLLSIIQVIVIGLLMCLVQKEYGLYIIIECGITFILAKIIWIIGTVFTVMGFSACGDGGNYVGIAIISMIPNLAIYTLSRQLLCYKFRTMNKDFLILFTCIAWALFIVSHAILNEEFISENRLAKAYAITALIMLFLVIAIITIKVSMEEHKAEQLTLHIDKLVHNAHHSKELIPAIEQELYSIRAESSEDMPHPLLKRIDAAIREVSALRSELGIEAQETYLIDKSFDTTGLEILDSQLLSEQLRALQHGISFEVIVNNQVDCLVDAGQIDQLHLQRIIGDLYRNAVSSVDKSAGAKEIMLVMGVIDGSYQIRFCDTEIDFPINVLNNLGKDHRFEGRNHYGYIDILNGLYKSKASIRIEEFVPGKRMFTKAVTITFDSLAKLRIESYRPGVNCRVEDIERYIESNKEREESCSK